MRGIVQRRSTGKEIVTLPPHILLTPVQLRVDQALMGAAIWHG